MSILKFKGKRIKGLETGEQWHGFSAKDLERPGAALLVWLTRIEVSRGHKMTEVASALRVTYGYLMQLKKGIGQTPRISSEVTEAAAEYLGCPPILVKLAAGQITLKDFQSPRDRMADDIDAAIAHIAADPDYNVLLPPRVDSLSQDVKASLVMLYQEATGKNLLFRKLDWTRILELIRGMLEVELTPTVMCKAGRS